MKRLFKTSIDQQCSQTIYCYLAIGHLTLISQPTMVAAILLNIAMMSSLLASLNNKINFSDDTLLNQREILSHNSLKIL